MAARRSAQQGQSIAPFILVGGLGVAGWAIYEGYPGLALLWVAVLVAAIAEPPVMFTGPKVGGYPTPAGPWETKSARDFDMAKDLRWRLVIPNVDWLPGWTPRASWLGGIAAGVLVTLAPVSELAEYWWVPALTTAVAVWQVAGSRRRTATPQDPNPGVKVAALKEIGVVGLATAAAGAAAGALLVSYALSHELTSQYLNPQLPVPAYLAAGAVAGAIAGSWWKWKPAALAEWEEMVATRADWDARWEPMFKAADQKPRLISHRTVGRLTVDTFAAPATLGAQGIIGMAMKLAPAIGAGVDATILNAPSTDAQGNPMPGTAHPLNFEIVYFPSGQTPDVTDPSTTPEEANYLIGAAMAKAVDVFGQGGARMQMVSVQPMHAGGPPAPEQQPSLIDSLLGRFKKKDAAPDPNSPVAAEGDQPIDYDVDTAAADAAPAAEASRAAWQVQVMHPAGGAAGWVRTTYKPQLMEQLGTLVLADERHELVFVGDLLGESTTLIDTPAPNGGEWLDYLGELDEEDEWNRRWEAALKQGANPPTPQFTVRRQGRLGSANVYHQPFLTKQGIDWTEYQKLEPKLSTAMAAAPFVSIVGFPAQRGKPGERHPQGFSVRWSDGPVPSSADRIAPSEEARSNQSTMNTPQHWVIAGHINSAFDSARLARPEVISARPLTSARSRGHIWKIEVRLFGGVTLSHLRGALGKLAAAMGVPWLRVAPGTDASTAVIVAGADFRRARLDRKDHEPYLIDLDWQQAFADSGVTGVGGMLPRMLSSETSATNSNVHVLDFELPSGVSVDDVKKGLPKLKGATKNSFVQVQPGVNGPASIRLLVSEEDPMPLAAEVRLEDLHETSKATVVPFATGVEGSTISWDLKRDPHLLITGTTGSGKSAASVTLIGSLLRRGVEVVVADPTKDAADFRWAEPWLKAMTITVEETAAMMDAVYNEVKRRRKLNGQYGAANYTELPEDIRPSPLVVYLDEFTSLIMTEKVTKPVTDDPGAMADYQEAMTRNALIAKIGDRTGRIAREARSAGVSLVLAAQELKSKTLESVPGGETLRGQMSRLALGKMSYGNLMAALKQPDDAPPLGEVVPQGRGVFETNGNPTVAVQVWYNHPVDVFFAEVLNELVEKVAPQDKLDLAPFMPKAEKQAVEGEIIGPPPTRGRAKSPDPVVIDAGSLELSLDDLDAFIDDDAEEQGDDGPGQAEAEVAEPQDFFAALNEAVPSAASSDEAELDWDSVEDSATASEAVIDPEELEDWPEPAVGPPNADRDSQPATAPDSLLVLAVEGVITPQAPAEVTEWGPQEQLDAGLFGEVAAWPAMLQQLRGPWQTAWLTDWEDTAAATFGHLLHADVARPVGDAGAGWKFTTLSRLLSAGIRRAVWVDAEAVEEQMMGVPLHEAAEEMAAEVGVELTIITPSGPVLTTDDVATIRSALGADSPSTDAHAVQEATVPLPVVPTPPEPPENTAPDPEPAVVETPRREPVAAGVGRRLHDDPFTAPVRRRSLPDPFAD